MCDQGIKRYDDCNESVMKTIVEMVGLLPSRQTNKHFDEETCHICNILNIEYIVHQYSNQCNLTLIKNISTLLH